MKRLFIVLLVAFLLIVTGCDDNSTEPEDQGGNITPQKFN